MSPQDGKGLNCWFPMPFGRARIEVSNDGTHPLTLYYYIDYELTEADDVEAGRLHARWRREAPTEGIERAGLTNDDYLFGGVNLDGAGNYVILEATGEGHYVGCHLDIVNRSGVGRGHLRLVRRGRRHDLRGRRGLPTLAPRHRDRGLLRHRLVPVRGVLRPVPRRDPAGGPNWSGEISLYRYHIEDPVRFRRSIRVTIEHGHANRRSDDLSSTAYWYQLEPHGPQPPYPSTTERRSRPQTQVADDDR